MGVEQAAAHIPRLRRYARLLAGDAARADDLVQDTLERACRKWPLWRAPAGGEAERQAALRAWLLTLMHNVFVNQWRERAAHEAAARLDLERALARLPQAAREVLLLVAVEELPYAAVAQVLGVPVGTVMSRLSRAREQLRRLMDGLDTAPPRAALKVIK